MRSTGQLEWIDLHRKPDKVDHGPKVSCRAVIPSFCLPADEELKSVHEEIQDLSKRAETQAMWDRIAKKHADEKGRAGGCLDGSTSSLTVIDETKAVETGVRMRSTAHPTATAVFIPTKTDQKTRIQVITDDVEIQRFYNAQREGTRSAQPIQIINMKTIMLPPFGETVIHLGCTFSMVKYDRDEPWCIECLAKPDGLLAATQIFDIDGVRTREHIVQLFLRQSPWTTRAQYHFFTSAYLSTHEQCVINT